MDRNRVEEILGKVMDGIAVSLIAGGCIALILLALRWGV